VPFGAHSLSKFNSDFESDWHITDLSHSINANLSTGRQSIQCV